jgi:L-serine dehydratase
VLLGLAGHEPDTVDVDAVPALLAGIRTAGAGCAAGRHAVAFDEKTDLSSIAARRLPFHANGMRFTGLRRRRRELLPSAVYYSVGGGFVVSDEVAADGSRQKAIAPDTTVLPCPSTAAPSCWQLRAREG